jgi:hypothetical protein
MMIQIIKVCSTDQTGVNRQITLRGVRLVDVHLDVLEATSRILSNL